MCNNKFIVSWMSHVSLGLIKYNLSLFFIFQNIDLLFFYEMFQSVLFELILTFEKNLLQKQFLCTKGYIWPQQPHFWPGLISHCLAKEIHFFFKLKVVICDHFKSLTLSKPYSKRIGILYFPINNTFSLLRSCENVRTHGVV